MRLFSIIFVALMFALPATAHAVSPAKQIVALKRANARLAAQVKAVKTLAEARRLANMEARAELAAADGELGELRSQVAALTPQVTALNAQVALLTTQRDDALAGLPAAIKAVPMSQFATLVFQPAREARSGSGCGDSYYSSDGYVSYDFNLGKFCI